MRKVIIEIIGWLGVALIVTAFTLNTMQILKATEYVYLLMNAVGGISIIISSYAKKDLQPVIINIVWVLVAFVAILQIVL